VAAWLAAALWLAGCAAKRDNAVTVANRWSKGCTVSLHEAGAGGYQFLDLEAGQTAGFSKLARGNYVLDFCVDGICKRDDPATTVDARTGFSDKAVSRTAEFAGCCDARAFVVQADGSVAP